MGTSSRHRIYLVQTTSSPHCQSRSVLLRNVEPDLHRKRRPDAWAVVTALFLAASAFGFLSVYLLYWARVGYSPYVYYQHVTISMLGVGTVLAVLLFGALVFIVVYPLMGLTVTYTFRALVTEIVQIYGFEPDERRHPNANLLFAASWPVTIWTIPFLTLVLSLGVICRPLWK